MCGALQQRRRQRLGAAQQRLGGRQAQQTLRRHQGQMRQELVETLVQELSTHCVLVQGLPGHSALVASQFIDQQIGQSRLFFHLLFTCDGAMIIVHLLPAVAGFPVGDVVATLQVAFMKNEGTEVVAP